MGLDANGTRFVLYAKKLGVDFARSAMIGRQFLSRVVPPDLERSLTEFGFTFTKSDIVRIFEETGGYAEPFLRFLGARVVHSFDASRYEGATQVHDMNRQIPETLKGQYSMVLDGGTLEHIFNFPVAIRNCMEMVQTGGHYLGISPTNNFMGHGFYQFSPELYFSAFTEKNGYCLVRMIALEDRPRAKWFSVKSPSSINRRITLTNGTPTYLFVLAQKIEGVPVFEITPQQSDYICLWERFGDGGTGQPQTPRRTSLRSAVGRLIPLAVKRRLRGEWKYRSGFSPEFFEVMDPTTYVQRFPCRY